jgi:hypothetical protein
MGNHTAPGKDRGVREKKLVAKSAESVKKEHF